jgi:hypothetical protein
MTSEMQDDFYDLATIEEELRTELERYHLGRTPREVAVRIRRHPRMRITAPNKMRWAIDSVTSYGGERPQTIFFKRQDQEWLENNLDAARTLISAAETSPAVRSEVGARIVWKNVPLNFIKDFLRKYRFHERSRDLDRDLILAYIEKQNELEALRSWNVVLMGRSGTGDDFLDLGPGVRVRMVNRSRLKLGDPLTANIKALMSPKDILADQKDPASGDLSADELFKRREGSHDGESGLLLIYPISRKSKPVSTDPTSDRTALEAVSDVIGVAMVFPPPKGMGTAHDYVSARLNPVSHEDPEGEENPEGDNE